MLEHVLGWFAVGRVPFLVVVIALLTSFGLIGLSLQAGLRQMTGYPLPASLGRFPRQFHRKDSDGHTRFSQER
jgi:hypothetical protein